MDNNIQIPKHVFDKEYSTQWTREVRFLEEKGINYTYGKRHYKYPVTRYKYTKTPELFLALAEFYNQVRNEKFFKDVEKTTKLVTPLEEGCIKVSESELSPSEKITMDFQLNGNEVADMIKEEINKAEEVKEETADDTE